MLKSKLRILIFIATLVNLPLIAALDPQEPSLIYINDIPNALPVDFCLDRERQIEIERLTASLSDEAPDPEEGIHIIHQTFDGGKYVVLEDESLWLIGSSYRGIALGWQQKQRLKLTYHDGYSNTIQLENIDLNNSAWGVNERKPNSALTPFILRLSNSVFDSDKESKVILNNGLIFKGPRIGWKIREHVFPLHNVNGSYRLYNLARNEESTGWQLVGNEQKGSDESIFNIELQLGKRVLGQETCIKAVSNAIYKCWSGLNEPNAPLGAFLFLGPTGVGKTELAKALTEVLYKNKSHFIRFDMSQFVSEADYTRLIGSPPGYVNHEEGGQLTEALRKQPRAIVLLDEIEKAHSKVRKAFLPILDEGYIVDAKNRKIMCNRAFFIMTSNICSEEIARLFNNGYQTEEVFKIIEPQVVSTLSPELYNRVTPLIFRPLTPDLMPNLVEQKLEEVRRRLKKERAIHLIIEPSARNYLIKYGFHATLGARPLKRLIEEKIVATVAYAIIKEGIPDGQAITISYSECDNAWHVHWKAIQ